MTNTLTVKDEIDQVMLNLRKELPSYRDRPSQKVMIAEIAKIFWTAEDPTNDNPNKPKNIIAIEAPTGTGKSQSYLLPSIIVGRRKAKKIVVSSATVKLQQQLCDSELPRLNECIEGGITYMIAKGRRRYVCPSRLEKEVGGANQMSLMAESNGGEADKRDTHIITLHKSLKDKSWDGERDSVKVDDAVWSDISTDSNGCTGVRCAHYKECPFFVARAQLEKVDVVVTNHDLLLSDLSLGGGVILTKPEETFYILDEAHHLPEKTLSSFASNYASISTLRMVEKMANDHAKSATGSLSHHIHTAADSLFDYLNDLTTALENLDSLKNKGDILRFPFGVVPDSFTQIGGLIRTGSEKLVTALSEYHELLSDESQGKEISDKEQKEMMDTSIYLDRANAIYDTWRWLLKDAGNDSPIAKWIEVIPSGRDVDYVLTASPVSAGPALKAAFWDKALGVVLTSATLTALGKFDLFLEQAGLSLIPERVRSIALPSPFDFQTQGKLVVPKMKNSPKNIEGHTAEVIQILPTLYPKKGGMLVLFTSRKQMEAVREALPMSSKQVTMMQGDDSLSNMIAKHKTLVDNAIPSVMFGLQSMAEGVDLPSDYCVRVVIVKLPFDVPSDPISKSYAEWLEANNRNPFSEVALPSASRKLAQYSGRLIRREDDFGEIYCLDNRLSTSSFGKSLIAALPPYKLELAR